MFCLPLSSLREGAFGESGVAFIWQLFLCVCTPNCHSPASMLLTRACLSPSVLGGLVKLPQCCLFSVFTMLVGGVLICKNCAHLFTDVCAWSSSVGRGTSFVCAVDWLLACLSVALLGWFRVCVVCFRSVLFSFVGWSVAAGWRQLAVVGWLSVVDCSDAKLLCLVQALAL